MDNRKKLVAAYFVWAFVNVVILVMALSRTCNVARLCYWARNEYFSPFVNFTPWEAFSPYDIVRAYYFPEFVVYVGLPVLIYKLYFYLKPAENER